jgi:hypothetical protein
MQAQRTYGYYVSYDGSDKVLTIDPRFEWNLSILDRALDCTPLSLVTIFEANYESARLLASE